MKKVNPVITDDELLAIVGYQSSEATGSEFASDELVYSRANALNYYYARPRGDEVDGNSNVQSTDVRDAVDAMLSQIMPNLTSGDLVQFEPQNQEDENQARVESSFCNWVVMEKNNGFMMLETLVKDVLLSKNATAKVRVDITEDVEKERYKGLSPEELIMVLQPTQRNQEIDITSFDEEAGNVNLKRITTTRKLVVESVPPENFAVTSEHRSPYLDDCKYCRERYWVTRSTLIEEGYDPELVMALPVANSDSKIDAIARNEVTNEQNFYDTSPSMQVCEVEEHYIRIDRDGDGVAELWMVKTVENNLLDAEEVECIPYANGVGWLNGHRYYGDSAYDKLKEVQDGKTHMLRQIEDNAQAGNHQKENVIEDQVNMEDFTTGRHNAIRRVESQEAAREVAHVDITPACIGVMDYWDRVRTARIGSSLDIQANIQSMPSNVGDAGVNVIIENLEKVAGLVTKNMTETLIKSLYKIVHKYLRMYFPEEMSAKISGEWNTTNPSQWLERDNLSIIVPPSRTEKLAQSVGIEKMLMMAMQDLQMGNEGITVSQDDIYQMRIDHARLMGIDSPEKYLVNPSSPQSQQVAQQRAQQQQAMMQQQQQEQQALQQQMMQAQISEIQRNWENDKEELQFKYTELETKTALDKYEADLKAETDEAKIVGDATTKLEVESMKVNKPEGMNEQTDD